jgi:hypothetical protein
VYRRNFFNWTRKDRQSYAEYMEDLNEQFRMWMQCSLGKDADQPTFDDVKMLLLRYRLDQALPEDLNLYLIDRKIGDVLECADLADEYELSRRVLQQNKKRQDRGTDHQERRGKGTAVSQRRKSSGGGSSSESEARDCSPKQDVNSPAHKTTPTKAFRAYCQFCSRGVIPLKTAGTTRRAATIGEGAG